MRLTLLTGVLALALSPTAVHADMWCIRNSGGMLSPICAFSSAQDCIQAAIVGPSGAVCVHDNTPAAAEAAKPVLRKHRAKSYKHRTSAR